MFTSHKQISPPSLVLKLKISEVSQKWIPKAVELKRIPTHKKCKCKKFCSQTRLVGEIYSSDVIMHRGYCLHGPCIKEVCNEQLGIITVYLWTKLKFPYFSGSQQLHLLHRNEEPTWPKLPIRIPKYKNQFCCCYRRVFTAHTALHYLRGTAGRGGPRLGTDKGLIQFFLQPSWQHFSSASQLASSKHSSSWPSQHTCGSTEGQKPGLSVVKKWCEK